MALTITSANSVFMLGVASVFPVPQQLQGFGVDEAFDTEPTDVAEVRLGVDSVGVSGWVPRLVKITVTLLPSSVSFLLFENWVTAMDQINEVLYCNATIVIPSIQRKYTGAQGSLTRYPPLPNVRRTLMDRQFELTFMPQGLGRPALTQAPV